ncbi:MAG: hypothetical protein CYG60_20590 [Actinobacteria bacterium]|nr:MAG: hypothetical protein CYG60_20590 [Actinomycetota bacterium]
MQNDSLFGHLASRLSSHPENIATEALNYVLNRSTVARRAFVQYASEAGVDLPETLCFRTQETGSDGAIPDLVGLDGEGRQVLLVEAKFWAGLTDNQPVAYLERLPPRTHGLLLFVAPTTRFPTLWPELLQRCRDAASTVEEVREVAEDFRAARVRQDRTLALASWRAVLAFILRALETEREILAASDVQQLQGLCERMDSDAFLPLRSEELTSDTGARIRQYCEIVNLVTDEASAAGVASIKGYRSAGGAGYYGRFLALCGNQCFLQFNAALWAKRRATPLWLRIDGAEAKRWLREALASLELAEPPRLIPDGDALHVPLDLPTSVEKQEVVAAVFEQVEEVTRLLAAHGRPL